MNRLQVCSSRGNKARCIEHAAVKETLEWMEVRKTQTTFVMEKYLPNTVKYSSIRKYSNIKVWLQNCMKGSYLLISEKCIWHPNFTCIRHCQITNSI